MSHECFFETRWKIETKEKKNTKIFKLPDVGVVVGAAAVAFADDEGAALRAAPFPGLCNPDTVVDFFKPALAVPAGIVLAAPRPGAVLAAALARAAPPALAVPAPLASCGFFVIPLLPPAVTLMQK